MRRARVLWLCGLIATCAGVTSAQEPQPVRLTDSYFASGEVLPLDFAWRFAPGDVAGAEAPHFDDSAWRPVRPILTADEMSWNAWQGIGWFRRHVVVDETVRHRPLDLQFSAPGIADVYLDGRLILTTGGTPLPVVPYVRRDSCIVTLDDSPHVLAVRYVYPRTAPPPSDAFGFRLTLSRPGVVQSSPAGGALIVARAAAIVALPVFLALLHLAFFFFDRRARENLFYAAEMVAFEIVLLNDFGSPIFEEASTRDLIGRMARAGPALAILFGLLTYYAIRTERLPRAWRLLVAAGVLVAAASYVAPQFAQPAWVVYFMAVLGEMIRTELRGRIVQRKEARFFLVSFGIFCFTIVLQILINYGVIPGVAGIRQIYLLGVVVSAVGMSLYLARRLGHSRVVEAENERKTIELAQARELQLSMLPRELPAVPRIELAAATQTAAEVGGDYYDVRRDGDASVLLAFGDATGHGLASGVVVTAAKALFNSLPTAEDASSLLTRCDDAMRGMNLAKFRMCLTLAKISSAHVELSSAAMPPVLLHRAASGEVEEIGSGGLPLGTTLRSRYESHVAALTPGDTLLFASDGFAELLDARHEPLGYDGVTRLFREAAAGATAHAVVEWLVSAAARHRGAQPQEDDITFVVVRIGNEA